MHPPAISTWPPTHVSATHPPQSYPRPGIILSSISTSPLPAPPNHETTVAAPDGGPARPGTLPACSSSPHQQRRPLVGVAGLPPHPRRPYPQLHIASTAVPAAHGAQRHAKASVPQQAPSRGQRGRRRAGWPAHEHVVRLQVTVRVALLVDVLSRAAHLSMTIRVRACVCHREEGGGRVEPVKRVHAGVRAQCVCVVSQRPCSGLPYRPPITVMPSQSGCGVLALFQGTNICRTCEAPPVICPWPHSPLPCGCGSGPCPRGHGRSACAAPPPAPAS